MELFELIKKRRSIRKYQERQIEKADLEKIVEAGLYAPNAGGGQRAFIVGIHDAELTAKIGRMNLHRFDRSMAKGIVVSKEQPSIIDDSNLKSAFYGAPSVCAIFGRKGFPYCAEDAYCCAENMVLMAASLGISSCIVARGEDTFDNPEGAELMRQWGVPENYVGVCFVVLGYCKGEYPEVKSRKPGRYTIVG